METKKNPQVNLEKFKFRFILTGLLVTVGLTLAAFGWASLVKSNEDLATQSEPFDDDLVEITRPDIKPPQPILKPQQMQPEILAIVEDTDDVEDNNDFTSETDENEDIIVNSTSEKEPETWDDVPFIVVEKMPEPAGGISGLRKFLAKNINYPKESQEIGTQGTVYLKFVVSAKGKVEQVQVTRGVDKLLDDEAVRVVKLLPDFKPGMQGGRAVAVWYSVPIVFKLN